MFRIFYWVQLYLAMKKYFTSDMVIGQSEIDSVINISPYFLESKSKKPIEKFR